MSPVRQQRRTPPCAVLPSRRRASLRQVPAVLAALFGLHALPAAAVEFGGLDLYGYLRGGAYSSPNGTPRGGYTLGGDAQKFRLGNEGDHGIEFGIGKTFDVGNGVKWGVRYMSTVWDGDRGTAEAYATMSGLDFAPSAEFWAGQRRLRLQDVHIVDKFFADYGDNLGAGVTGIAVGKMKLGIGLFTSGSIDNHNKPVNNGRRLNVDLSEIPVNPGGSLRLTGTVVSGDFRYGSNGGGLSLVHNQENFLVKDLKNSLFLQAANGHAGLNGQFFGLGDGSAATPGARSFRIVDSLNWQSGAFGGQTLVAYQTSKAQGGASDGTTTRDWSIGGRISYDFTRHFKLIAEAGTTRREIDRQPTQRLSKFTLAPAIATGPGFWTRPEMRLYVTRVIWNDAAAAANANSFGANGRTANTLAGVQIEAWW